MPLDPRKLRALFTRQAAAPVRQRVAAAVRKAGTSLTIKPRSESTAFVADITTGGKRIGEMRTLDYGDRLKVREVEIDAAHRGLGHGRRAYEQAGAWAKSKGKLLRSDPGGYLGSLSPEADRVWQGFVRRGQARKVAVDGGLRWYYEMT